MHLQKVNPKMLEPFHRYEATPLPSKAINPTCLAHQVVFAASEDKYVTLHYLDAGGKEQSFMLSSKVTLDSMLRTHVDGFMKVNRSTMVNIDHIDSLFRTSDTDYAISLKGMAGCLDVSRRLVPRIKKILKEKQ